VGGGGRASGDNEGAGEVDSTMYDGPVQPYTTAKRSANMSGRIQMPEDRRRMRGRGLVLQLSFARGSRRPGGSRMRGGSPLSGEGVTSDATGEHR